MRVTPLLNYLTEVLYQALSQRVNSLCANFYKIPTSGPVIYHGTRSRTLDSLSGEPLTALRPCAMRIHTVERILDFQRSKSRAVNCVGPRSISNR